MISSGQGIAVHLCVQMLRQHQCWFPELCSALLSSNDMSKNLLCRSEEAWLRQLTEQLQEARFEGRKQAEEQDARKARRRADQRAAVEASQTLDLNSGWLPFTHVLGICKQSHARSNQSIEFCQHQQMEALQKLMSAASFWLDGCWQPSCTVYYCGESSRAWRPQKRSK